MMKRTLTGTSWIAAMVLSVLPAMAQSRGETDGRIPITDPALLERMGFPPDTTDVYATPQAFQQLHADSAESPAMESLATEAEADSVFGTRSVGLTPVSGSEFAPMDSATGYETFSAGIRYCTIGSPFFEADLQGIPDGARLVNVSAWHYDDSPEDLEVFLFSTCFRGSDISVTNLGSTASFGSDGWNSGTISLAPDEIDVDPLRCTYSVRVRLDGANVGSCSEGTGLRIAKARASWRRQVSPAPATARFDDVPTSHIFFQQIEALAASGITSGCEVDGSGTAELGGGSRNFCPGAPLTRGQMAAFLADALGLHWGQPLF